MKPRKNLPKPRIQQPVDAISTLTDKFGAAVKIAGEGMVIFGLVPLSAYAACAFVGLPALGFAALNSVGWFAWKVMKKRDWV